MMNLSPHKLAFGLNFFSLTIPYGIMLVLTHWFMLAIIGVRIYADNFSREIDIVMETLPVSLKQEITNLHLTHVS